MSDPQTLDGPAEDPKAAKRRRKVKNALQAPKRGFWRTNVEAFTVAIVMALVIKTYAFEAFQVPTPSMEPTIIGRTPGGDRIIVNKFVYEIRDPERFDVVVFRYPLARMVNYVKRLVGLPGERLKITHGDLYVSPGEGEEFVIARKSAELADAIFEANPVIPEDEAEEINSASFRRSWEVPASRVRINNSAHAVQMDAGNAKIYVTTRDPITPTRNDPYASTEERENPPANAGPVSDVRLDLEITPDKGCQGLLVTIQDGTQPNLPFELFLAVDGAGQKSWLKHGKHEVGTNGDPSNEKLKAVSLEAGENIDVQVTSCDDRFRVVVDGEEVCRYEFAQNWRSAPHPGPTQVKFGLAGGSASFTKVALYRDIYYTVYEPDQMDFNIPEGHYLFFGDNSPRSLDARGWRLVGIRLRNTGKILLGDLEAVSDSFEWPRRDNNPYFETEQAFQDGQRTAGKIVDDSAHYFLDIYGNQWKLESGSYDVLDLNGFELPSGSPEILGWHGRELPDPAPGQIGLDKVTTPKLTERIVHTRQAFRAFSVLMHYVPRNEIMGQANLIFWPPSRWGVIR